MVTQDTVASTKAKPMHDEVLARGGPHFFGSMETNIFSTKAQSSFVIVVVL